MSQSVSTASAAGADGAIAALKLDPLTATTGEILDALVRRYGGEGWERSLGPNQTVRVHFRAANGDALTGQGATTRDAALHLATRLAALYPEA